MSEKQREDAMKYRRIQRLPKHAPPHFDFEGEETYLVSAACYEHRHIIGHSSERMTATEAGILEACAKYATEINAWCILPNHYHVLSRTDKIGKLRKELGLFHGRSSFEWNGEEQTRGRQVWHNCFERRIKSQRHYFASLNYVLNNPVHHGYVEKWTDWIWSSAGEYLNSVGRDEAERIWKEYPVLNYGEKWDKY